MDKAIIGNQAAKVLKKGKKKQSKDELDRQKQAEKKRRRLEKALANSAAIISELEKKKQKKKEEQQRLDEEGAAIAEAVALHVLIGEEDSSDEPCRLMLNKHRKCNHSAGFDFTQGTADIMYPSDGLIRANHHAYAPNKGRWTDWEFGRPLPSWREVRDPCYYYQGTFHQSVTSCPGFIAAQAVSSLRIREESSDMTSPTPSSKGAAAATVVNRMNLYREI